MKAPGPDGLRPIILKNLDQGSREFQTKLYKHSIRIRQIPKSWKEMSVVFIPKQGKGDYTSPKAYRPITLSCFILKGLERVVLWYMREKVVKTRLVSQHTYTRGLSTETALLEVADYIERSLYRQKVTIAASLDCSGAFDWVSFSAMKEALKRHNTPENITEWYDTLLKNRRIKISLQGCEQNNYPW